jgi:hypothetical protein
MSASVADYSESFSVGPNDFIDAILSEDLTTQHLKNSVTSLKLLKYL